MATGTKSPADEIAADAESALQAIKILACMCDLPPGRNGRINGGDLIEHKEKSQFLHVASTLVRYARELRQVTATWSDLSAAAGNALDLAAAKGSGPIAIDGSTYANASEAVNRVTRWTRDYFDAVGDDVETIRRQLVEYDEHEADEG